MGAQTGLRLAPVFRSEWELFGQRCDRRHDLRLRGGRQRPRRADHASAITVIEMSIVSNTLDTSLLPTDHPINKIFNPKWFDILTFVSLWVSVLAPVRVQMAAYFDRLALIANKSAEVAAKLEEIEQLREQVRRAERMPAIGANHLNRLRLVEGKPRPH